jgi:uncharacterized protein (TIGR02118 family)
MLSGDDIMLKFMVVLVRKAGMDRPEFKRYFKDVHQPLARRIAGLRRYVQNFAVDDPHRKPPAWDAIIELYFDNWGADGSGLGNTGRRGINRGFSSFCRY